MFAGELDGANHTVSNLNLNVPDSVAYAGLVGFNTGTIKNLNVANARITGRTVGGIAGGNMGTIQNTSVSGTLSGTDSVGGLVGFQVLATSLLADSVSTASITGSSSYGGVIGDLDNGTLRNTHYNADTVLVNGATSSLSMGGLRGAQYTDWISHGRTLDIANYSSLLPRDSASGAYLVSNVAGLNALLGFVDRPDLTFRLSANIDLAPAPGLFLPYLMGTLDGNGHQISNLNVNRAEPAIHRPGGRELWHGAQPGRQQCRAEWPLRCRRPGRSKPPWRAYREQFRQRYGDVRAFSTGGLVGDNFGGQLPTPTAAPACSAQASALRRPGWVE